MIRIGIATRITASGDYDVLPAYLQAIQSAGGTPVLIRPHDVTEELVDTLHGILIPGGADVDPALYGQLNSASEGIDPSTDELDLRLIALALAHHLPLLGICRGIQVINVALGGTLVQDLPSQRDASINHNVKRPLVGHRVTIDPSSRLASLLGNNPEVNSYHHQGLDRLALGLRAIAWSTDGLIEAVEGKNLLAVQWHPERMTQLKEVQALLIDFIKQCSPQ
jgi:gamma-glutamyl-gamma-aminobutyrate hydrolase PuuD